jgi:hypothetical protein
MSEQIDLPHTGLGLRSAGLAFGGTPAQRSLGFSLKPRVTQRYSGRGSPSDLCHSRVVQRRLEQRSIRLAPFPWVSTET